MEKFYVNIVRTVEGQNGKPYRRHFARVALDAPTEAEARDAAQLFVARFAAPEFDVSMSAWQETGRTVSL
jgi:hypothetical protein